MTTTIGWVVAAVTLAIATAALALAIVALVAGTGLQQTQELQLHTHELPAHEHDQGLGWEWLGLLAGFDEAWSDGSDAYGAEIPVEGPMRKEPRPGDGQAVKGSDGGDNRTMPDSTTPTADDHAAAATEPMPPASDAERAYLRDLCLAGFSFVIALVERDAEWLTGDDPAATADVFLEPMRELAEDLRASAPPEAIAAHHATMLANFEKGVALFNEIAAAGGEIGYDLRVRYDEFRNRGYPSPPAAVAERLSLVASEVEECQDVAADFLRGFLGVG